MMQISSICNCMEHPTYTLFVSILVHDKNIGVNYNLHNENKLF